MLKSALKNGNNDKTKNSNGVQKVAITTATLASVKNVTKHDISAENMTTNVINHVKIQTVNSFDAFFLLIY